MGQAPGPTDGQITSAVNTVPVTLARPPPVGLGGKLKNPGQPRATEAVSAEVPDGSTEAPPRTVLQQHCDFWDRNGDGKIYPWDTYIGFHRLGLNPLLCCLAAFIINGAFSLPSQNTWRINPLLPVCTKDIHRTKHGSDSESYDTEGRFVPQKFEEIFSKYGHDDTLTFWEMWSMTEANRNVMDPFGWTAEKLEWLLLWYLAADDDKKLRKETVRAMYDGTLFWDIAAKRKAKLQAAQADKKQS